LVSVLSVDSKPTRNSVLKLVETMQSKERPVPSQSDITNCTELGLLKEVSQSILSSVFRLLEEVTLDLSHFWAVETVSQSGRRMLETLLPNIADGSPLTQPAYWLVVRLGR
jgi:hypothetical protein